MRQRVRKCPSRTRRVVCGATCLHRRGGPRFSGLARHWTPGQQHTISCCAAPGEREECGERILQSEIGAAHFRIVDELLGVAAVDDAAGLHDVAAIGARKRQSARPARPAARSRPRRGLSPAHPSIARRRPGRGRGSSRRSSAAPAPPSARAPWRTSAARRRTWCRRADAGARQPRKQRVHALQVARDRGLVVAPVGAHQQIVLDGHAVEKLPAFRHLHKADAQRPGRASSAPDLRPSNVDVAGAGDDARQRAQQRRLAGAVAADQRDDLGRVNLQRHVAAAPACRHSRRRAR